MSRFQNENLGMYLLLCRPRVSKRLLTISKLISPAHPEPGHILVIATPHFDVLRRCLLFCSKSENPNLGPDTSFLKSGKTDRKIPIFVSGGSHIFVLPEISDSDLRHFWWKKRQRLEFQLIFFDLKHERCSLPDSRRLLIKLLKYFFFRNKNVFWWNFFQQPTMKHLNREREKMWTDY